jgi:hypothetical protein
VLRAGGSPRPATRPLERVSVSRTVDPGAFAKIPPWSDRTLTLLRKSERLHFCQWPRGPRIPLLCNLAILRPHHRRPRSRDIAKLLTKRARGAGGVVFSRRCGNRLAHTASQSLSATGCQTTFRSRLREPMNAPSIAASSSDPAAGT